MHRCRYRIRSRGASSCSEHRVSCLKGLDELFRASSWQSIFEGMGIRPKRYSPRLDNVDYSEIATTLKTARAAIQGMVSHLPTHEEFLRNHGAGTFPEDNWTRDRRKSMVLRLSRAAAVFLNRSITIQDDVTMAKLSVAFFLQMLVILATCRLVGWLGQRFLKQPQVVGEMIAGVLLGPSLFGLFAPDLQKWIFPPETKGVLYVGAQFGVGLRAYMFLVGLGFRGDHFKANVHRAAAVSVSGIVALFLIAPHRNPLADASAGLLAPTATRFDATLFMGAAIAITAFPMLARIIHERGLSQTSGHASCPRAPLTTPRHGVSRTRAGELRRNRSRRRDHHDRRRNRLCGHHDLCDAASAEAPRPLGRKRSCRRQTLGHGILGITLMLFMACACIADGIGLHAVFGGFLLGTVMPRGALTERVKTLLESFTVVLLLPMFFTFSGLNTQLTMVNTRELLLVAIAILAASTLAKFGACWAAARLSAQDNRTALGIGALMNSRGLMELIIINIGLQAGVIQPALFSMLVMMAIVSTLMASPVFEWVYGREARSSGELQPLESVQ